jgi:dihydroflavonol-4-reductase
VTRALLARGAEVVALLEPGASTSNLDGLDVERSRSRHHQRGTQLFGVFDGARYLLSPRGQVRLLAQGRPPRSTPSTSKAVKTSCARRPSAGVDAIVYTSTVATLGLWETKSGRPSNEDDVADLSHLYGNYKQTKYVAEHEVLRLAAQGAPVVLVLPTMPHGPFDHRPTPSGKVVLDYLNGRMPGFVDTAMNVAHVDDLAAGHLLALEKGTPGSQLHLRWREHHHGATTANTQSEVTGLPRAETSLPGRLPDDRGLRLEFIEGTCCTESHASPGSGADGVDDDDLRRLARAQRDRLPRRAPRPSRSSIRPVVR